MAQMKEHMKTPEKELSDGEIANLSDAEFKTLVIRMLMIELSHKMKEEMKATQSEIRKIYREPVVKGREPGLKLFGREGRNKHPTRTE